MRIFKKSIFLAVSILFAAVLLPEQLNAQNQKNISWSIVKMDSTWNSQGDTKVKQIISKYKPTIDPLMVVIGSTDKELDKFPPESPLSNLSAGIIADCAQKYLAKKGTDTKVDIALTNFGGIRTSIPAGEITAFDILSVFPFDNRVVIVDLEGKYVRELLENFAKRGKVEALSGVEMVINQNQLEKCLVGGLPIDDHKIYKVASIDFLLTGGDSVYALKYASNVVETGIVLRDAVIEYIKDITRSGKKVTAEKDGRVVVKK